MRMSKSNYFWLGILAVAFVCYAWAGTVYDPLLGKLRSGVADTLQLTSGESVTVSSGGSIAVNRGGNYRVEGAGAVADNLDIITGGQEGDILFLRPATAGHTITIRHATAGSPAGGNITTPGAVDYVVPDNAYVQLYFRGESWISVCPAVAGVGGLGDVVASGTLTDGYVLLGGGTKTVKAATVPATMESSLTLDQPGANVDSPRLTLSGDKSGNQIYGAIYVDNSGPTWTLKTYSVMSGESTVAEFSYGSISVCANNATSSALKFDTISGTNQGSLTYNDSTKFTLSSGLTVGSGVDGFLKVNSEQGTTDYFTLFQPGTQTQDVTYTLPVDDGTASQVLSTDGSGVLSWTTVAESDTLLTVTNRGATAETTCAFESALAVSFGKNSATNTAGKLRLWSAGTVDYFMDIVASEQTQDITYTMPPNDGDAGAVLTTNGSGTLTWTGSTGQWTYQFDGGGSAITAGTYYNGAFRLPYDVTVTGWQLVAPESGTCSLGISKSTFATWPTATSILGAQAIAATAAWTAEDTDIANWGETNLTAGDYLIPSVASASETGLALTIFFRRR